MNRRLSVNVRRIFFLTEPAGKQIGSLLSALIVILFFASFIGACGIGGFKDGSGAGGGNGPGAGNARGAPADKMADMKIGSNAVSGVGTDAAGGGGAAGAGGDVAGVGAAGVGAGGGVSGESHISAAGVDGGDGESGESHIGAAGVDGGSDSDDDPGGVSDSYGDPGGGTNIYDESGDDAGGVFDEGSAGGGSETLGGPAQGVSGSPDDLVKIWTAASEADLPDNFNAIYAGDPDEPVAYLTFDMKTESGYTESVLDLLAKRDVKASFFISDAYLAGHPEIAGKIISGGHLAAYLPPAGAGFANFNEQKFNEQISGFERAFREAAGCEPAKMLRPPDGEYSAASLALASGLGYKTAFWSFTFADDDASQRFTTEYAYKKLTDNLRNGVVIMLHTSARENVTAIDRFIGKAADEGFLFSTLDKLGR